MASTTAQRPAIRVDPQVYRFIEDQMRPKESYNDVLRRLLGIERERATEPPK